MLFLVEKVYFSSFLLQMLVVIVSLTACVTLVLTLGRLQENGSSYSFPVIDDYYYFAFYVDIFVFVIFLFDYIMRLCANSRVIGKYLISVNSLVFIFSVLSVATFIDYENITICIGYLVSCFMYVYDL